MSTTEILSLISLISFILSGVSLILAIFLWIKFRIPAVIGDLSGRTARKSIERMRVNNEKTGNKSFKSSTVNLERGKLTDTMPDSKELVGDIQTTETKEENSETGLLMENRQNVYDTSETDLLVETEQTTLLAETAETGLLVDENATTLLVQEEIMNVCRSGIKLVILDEVMLVHTSETID